MKYPHVVLSVAILISFTALAACIPGNMPELESEAPATPGPAATAAPAPTTTPATTAEPEAETAPVHSSSFDATKYENVWVHAIEEKEHEGRSLLRVSYPLTEQDAINARMEAVTQEFIDEWRAMATETEASYQKYKEETGREAATFITHYRQHFDVSIANENLIFFDIVRSIHTGGTGNSFVVGYIFDRRTGAELTIADLFVDDSYLERLSTLSREALAERISKEELASDPEWVESGTAPAAENFDNILLLADGTILVRFDKYQVAAGVEGVVEIVLPLDAIADLLKPEIRELLGLEAETTSRRSGVATSAVHPQALALSPEPASTDFSASIYRNSALSIIKRFPRSVQPKATAQDDINCREVACVALTFDDGPSYYTEGLLDILKEHNVKATFFVLGTQVRIQSETVQRMFREGHQIGNHTWDHPNLTKMSDDQIREQLQQTDNLIAQIIGESTPFLRPPYGAYNDNVLAASGLPIIFWSVDPLDWKDRDAATVAARIVDAPAGAIILSHDIHKSTVDAVPAIITALKSRGIHMVTVTKLFEPQTLHAQNVYIRQNDSPSQ
ncbi:MAG: polysaccharide deacetylase family protein [Caldilineaceae bacterium]|nr:polysaccharide deacetylase family protein [Caldilineaceae bacterium]